MNRNDLWTNILVGVVSIVFATIPPLLTWGVNGHTVLLIAGSVGVFLLTGIEAWRLRDKSRAEGGAT